MRVYVAEGETQRLVGRADVPTDSGSLFEVPLLGAVTVIREQFTIGTITYLPPDGGPPVVERAVLLTAGQLPELLPGWQPLAS